MGKEIEYYTTGQVARMFGVDSKTVRRWVDKGKLTCVRTVTNQRRFDRKEIDSVLEASYEPIHTSDSD